MGIVNVTPDSFSDGGRFLGATRRSSTVCSSSARAPQILDVGGESTRPGRRAGGRRGGAAAGAAGGRRAARRTAQRRADLDRHVQGVGRARGAATRARARQRRDARCAATRRWRRWSPSSGADCCLMHMLGEPRTMQRDPRYDDVVDDVKAFLHERLEFAVARGHPRSAIAARPGHRLRQDASRTTSSCCARLRRARRARAPARDRHLAQELSSGASRRAPTAGREPRRRRRLRGDDRHQRARAGARRERVPRPRRAPVRDALAVAAATLGARWTPSPAATTPTT